MSAELLALSRRSDAATGADRRICGDLARLLAAGVAGADCTVSVERPIDLLHGCLPAAVTATIR